MDFDDLDAEIEKVMAEGNTEALGAIAASLGKKKLKRFTIPKAGMVPIPCNHRLACSGVPKPDRRVCIRAFLFYGPGQSAESFKFVETFPSWLETAVYEWPGHGSRRGEPQASDLDALADDAFEALLPAMEQVCEGADMEGAPFVFIGHSVGTQIMTCVAKKILMRFSMAPSLVVVLDRAPPHMALLSEDGQKALEADPDDLLRAYDMDSFPVMDRKLWANDLRYANEEKDPFFHKFECDILVLTADRNKELEQAAKQKKGTPYKLANLRIEGGEEEIQIPIEEGTKAKLLRETVLGIFAYRRDTAKVGLSGADGKPLSDDDAVPGGTLIVSGLKDFKHPRYPWPHVSAIIGAGFQGIKTAMQYMVHCNENIVLFDRHASCGGDAWHNSATKHSKMQTDFGAFNIWFGHEYTWTGNGGYGSIGTGPDTGRNVFAKPFSGVGAPPDGSATGAGTGVDYHPVRQQVLNTMQHACEEYGITPHVRFESDVVGLQIVGEEDAHDRHYKLTVRGSGGTKIFNASIVYHFPGAYDVNRQVTYPGESSFGGSIGYGQGHDDQGGKFVWDDGKMMGARGGIIGNGAFAIENVRSCCEYGAHKVYLITRRKSLACPRLPCWFCHQGPIPTPAWFLLEMFKPMYQLGGFEDPDEFYSVIRSGPENVTISQSSRFGIGDVTFICTAYGLLEYKVTELERLTRGTLHLKSGEKLENCSFLIKALGLLGDPRVDKLQGITHRIGNFVNGDWRRIIAADATGMHAANFATFSAGPGVCSMVKQWYYWHNHPWEMYAAIEKGMLKIVPKHLLSNTQPDQTVYMANVQYEMAAGGLMSGYFPTLGRVMGDEGTYKHCLLHSMHPTDKFFEYCEADWNRYQKMFQERNGCADKPWLPYPYTKEMVGSWFELYSEKFPYCPIRVEGPDEGTKAWCIDSFKQDWESRQQEHIPLLVKDSPLCKAAKEEGSDPYATACAATVIPKRRKYTASSSSSALDFDASAYEEWKMWIGREYAFTQEGVPAKSADILTHPETWGKVLPLIEAKKPRF